MVVLFDPNPLERVGQPPDVTWIKEEGTMIRKSLTLKQGGTICQEGRMDPSATSIRGWTCGAIMRKVVVPLFLLVLLAAGLPVKGYGSEPTYPIIADVQTTRQRTVSPIALPIDPNPLLIKQVDQYADRGYSSWQWGNPVNYGPLLLEGTTQEDPTKAETLLSFFTISDIHIVDKESPVQAIYAGVDPLNTSFGEVNTSAYSPIMLSTTHVLDAAVQTINALHHNPRPAQAPFDFGMSLGDDANSNQYNELRWFIDVMDGKKITPSSGAHQGAKTIDYQRAYQSAGLDKSIPWYQTIGNHDQFWCGTLPFTDYVRKVLIGKTVMDMGVDNTNFPTFDVRQNYMGVIDGTTEYGTIIGAGPVEDMETPIVARDRARRALSTNTSPSLNWMKEFFKTTSLPKGHGFTQANLDNDFASYTFEPKATVPIKVIVLDDTCKENPYAAAGSYARGCLDQTRYDWLVNELDKGQAEGKLMIITAHIPVGPQWNVPDALPIPPNNLPNTTVVPLFISTCLTGQTPEGPCDPVPPYSVVTDTTLLETLHNYSNLILWIAGHRHINTVTPQSAAGGKGAEFGFWEVETPSLRDFPQQFRTFKIVRNTHNAAHTVSIFITDVDPAVQADPAAPHASLSPAAKSRGYAIGANRISTAVLDDTTPRVFNAELIKPLATHYAITVNVTGPGTVKMGPYYPATCTSTKSCSASYLPGTEVTLVATAAKGASFSGWTQCEGKSTCTITMNSDVTVTAAFTRAPTVAVTPAQKDFGKKKVGGKKATTTFKVKNEATATFKVKNVATKGVADLSIGSITIGGTNKEQFTLKAGKDRCSGQTIKSGKSCTFKVSFMPTSKYTKVGTITISSNDTDGPKILQLTGVGK